jgi:hypothetical protein
VLAVAMAVRAAWYSASSVLWQWRGCRLGDSPFPVLKVLMLTEGNPSTTLVRVVSICRRRSLPDGVVAVI